jgi:hypothetical protein
MLEFGKVDRDDRSLLLTQQSIHAKKNKKNRETNRDIGVSVGKWCFFCWGMFGRFGLIGSLVCLGRVWLGRG